MILITLNSVILPINWWDMINPYIGQAIAALLIKKAAKACKT